MVEKASNIGPASIEIAYERLGDSGAPPVLPIMGLAGQLIHWPDAFCHALTEPVSRLFASIVEMRGCPHT